MKKIVLVVALAGFMVAGNYSFGQDNPEPPRKEKCTKLSPEERAEKRTERIVSELELTEDQAAKVNALNLDEAKKMEEIKEKKMALKAEAKGIHAEHEVQLETILTPEQLERHKAVKAERAANRVEKKKNADCNK
jgi:Spy/CpxP family protein refolding chaperone